LRAHLWAQWEQKSIKNFVKSSRGRSQGLQTENFQDTHQPTAHRAVIFALAQISCLYLGLLIVNPIIEGIRAGKNLGFLEKVFRFLGFLKV